MKAANPDIIYYPSIGMAIWVIAMASLRLAPIQVMTYGHPATSNSPYIDYGIIEADCCVEDRFSEKMVTLPPNTVRPTEYEAVPQRHVPRKTDVVRSASRRCR
jgi:predicted O-linked N-acetylglucosamine transferase (SPINDLY family)